MKTSTPDAATLAADLLLEASLTDLPGESPQVQAAAYLQAAADFGPAPHGFDPRRGDPSTCARCGGRERYPLHALSGDPR